MLNTDQNFATLQDPYELAAAILARINAWRNWAQAKGLIGLWQRKITNYYGISANGNTSQMMTPGGSEGELSLVKVNDLHQLIQAQLVLVTSQRPAGQARAVNSDAQSLRSARIGTAISEYYMSDLGLEARFVAAAEIALLCDESYVDLFWNKLAGDVIADDGTGHPEMSGDIEMRVHAPWNVARDMGAPVNDQHWNIITYVANRFDAAASYPKFEDEIKNAKLGAVMQLPMCKIPDDSDMIYVHLLVHDRTPGVPEGRYVIVIGDRTVYDSPLPYKDYPVERMTPSDVIDGPIGYCQANDIMGLEEITDALHSIITSNNVTFGGQSIVGPVGGNLNINDLGKGLRYFELPPDLVDKLRPLQMTKTAPETFQYIQALTQKKEQQTGSASGTLAQQAIQGASGSAMALIQAQSIQYNSGIQRSYYRLLSSSMTKLISVLRSYADTPRVARIVGKAKSQGLKEFKYTGQDLNSISSIVYELVNPISQTVGGRLTMAQDLIKANMCKSPKMYITVATTGNLDALTQDDEADQLLIIEENEELGGGQQIRAVITEMHADHIKAHMSVLSSVKAKSDPNIIQVVLDHIQEHVMLWTEASTTNPGILMATGQQPLMPPAPPPGMMPPGPGGPPAGIHAPPGAAGPMTGDGAGIKPPEPNLPNMPINPLTKQRAEAPPGAPVQ